MTLTSGCYVSYPMKRIHSMRTLATTPDTLENAFAGSFSVAAWEKASTRLGTPEQGRTMQ